MRGCRHRASSGSLGSVPRSVADPIATNAVNIDGFLNMLVAARDAKVSRFVYAASSSTYGDHPGLPKEIACAVGSSIGLRYFNVFGPRQDPEGAYAAVIPRWIVAMIEGRPVHVHGDGSTSRDFCYVANAMQANLLAACVEDTKAINQDYNVAVGDRTTLSELLDLLRESLRKVLPSLPEAPPTQGSMQASAYQAYTTARLPAEPQDPRWSGRIDAVVRPSRRCAVEIGSHSRAIVRALACERAASRHRLGDTRHSSLVLRSWHLVSVAC